MDGYIKNLIKSLCNIYDYNIIEFNNMDGLVSNWGVVKGNEYSAEVIFFSSYSCRNSLDKNKFETFLKSYLQCSDLKLIEVIIGNNLNLQEYNKINPQCELILIDVVEKKVLCCSNTLKEVTNKLVYCMNRINTASSTNNCNKLQMSFITYSIIAANIVMYIVTAYLSNNILDSNINVLVFLGAKVDSLIAQGQYYRLFTCMFLHGGIIHIALNMYALFIIGPLIENIYGKVRYIIIYFTSGITASILSYMFSPSISIGASGAIFGLLGAALVFGVKMKDRIHKDYVFNIVSVIFVNLIVGFSISNVDNFGHLGGLIGGVIVSSLMFNYVLRNRN